jgi:hypothetical protein
MNSGDGIEFRYTRGGDTIIVATDADPSAAGLVELFRRFMLAAGYTTETVSQALNEDE